MTLRQQVFTSPGTWTWPGKIAYVDVFLVGGGGSAYTGDVPFPAPSGGPSPYQGNGGGGGVRNVIGVPVSGPVPVTIGAGGPNSVPPGIGGTTSFGPISVAGGGSNSSAPPIGGGGTPVGNPAGSGGLYGMPGTPSNGVSGPGGQFGIGGLFSIGGALTSFGVEGLFDIGASFDGYGAGAERPGGSGYYGSFTANMGGGGTALGPNRSPVPNSPFSNSGTSGVVVVKWFE